MTHDSRNDTVDHIEKVQNRLGQMIDNLEHRAEVHDASKLISPEKEGFDSLGHNVPEYGTQAYIEHMRAHKPTIKLHQANNSHHPEHYPNGIDGMSLLDIVEMFADWKGAGERSGPGDIRKSLDIGRERFGISDQLYSILLNTIEEMEW